MKRVPPRLRSPGRFVKKFTKKMVSKIPSKIDTTCTLSVLSSKFEIDWTSIEVMTVFHTHPMFLTPQKSEFSRIPHKMGEIQAKNKGLGDGQEDRIKLKYHNSNSIIISFLFFIHYNNFILPYFKLQCKCRKLTGTILLATRCGRFYCKILTGLQRSYRSSSFLIAYNAQHPKTNPKNHQGL